MSDRLSVQSDASGRFFDSFADQFDSLYDGKRNAFMRWVDRRFRSDMFGRFNRTFELLGDLTGKSVVDIGCGSGPYVQEALRRGATRVTGIDPAESMLGLVRRRIADGASRAEVVLVRGYFPAVSPSHTHDCAIVMGVMDYVADAPGFVRALRQSITVGAAVSFPSVHWFRSPVRRKRYQWRRCPLFLYTEHDIRRVLIEGGVTRYEVEKLPGAGMDFVVWMQP